MCGIAGVAGWATAPDETTATLRRMCAAIEHRGPDDEGHFVAPGIGLGMRRLSVIDVHAGHQPIGNEDGDVQIVFNGEIYNHRELRARLEACGHRFATHSDTETIVHGYEEWGDRVVDQLRGMFGFAIWDARRRRLLVARDRLGIKPLYYWVKDGGLAFASELGSLRALPGFDAQIHAPSVLRYLLFGYVPEPDAIYAGVRKLPPGHTLTWEPGSAPRIQRYWTPVRDEVAMDERDAVEELRRLLDESVRLHLESDVPLGAFLSGGIDSSTVVALMARQLDRPVRTFSIGFDDPRFNEAPHAAAVAKAIGTDHTELILRPDADALLERVITMYDEPFADSSALPTYLVSALARKHVTVSLSGDGGDELFGGYTRYAERLGQRELPALARQAIGGVARLLPHGARGRNRLLDMGRSARGRYAATVASPLPGAEGGVVRASLLRGMGDDVTMDGALGALFDEASGRDFATQMMLVDMQSYLPGDILTKVDRASMAVSLEARVPLLDHVLAEFAVTVPARLKMRDGTGKWLLRQAIEGIVPPAVLTKPKQGFGVPLGQWFAGPLRHRIDGLLRERSEIAEYVEPGAVARLHAEHVSGRRDHSMMLWRLLVLETWLARASLPAGVRAPDLADVATFVGA
ncbi:asparagine synthase (glutamine-hydrolyzing) [Roseisolibacter agri]|uniref:asparagine synthase (glutamine-hydrolyzing) n=1 Tax=Roseisolibacter agri TaxID=2014610 RepID=A0AA37VD56_9BACT|nr:asparagine synthase (glutamine-hydrolyzing) [Roseisolibacter agri]GLC28483.1 amidotransferase 1, exosortase A system-associated [Roseisolibacter agri]